MEPVRVGLHSRVIVELVASNGDAEQLELTLVPGRQADLKSGLLDENTPLGRTLMGHCAGETLPYALGDLCAVRILAVAEGAGFSSTGAAARRRADVQKAAAQSEITSQMIFSTASGSKWGDYDVDVNKLLQDDEES